MVWLFGGFFLPQYIKIRLQINHQTQQLLSAGMEISCWCGLLTFYSKQKRNIFDYKIPNTATYVALHCRMYN